MAEQSWMQRLAGGRDSVVVAACLPSLEEIADGLMAKHDDLNDAEALGAGARIRQISSGSLIEKLAADDERLGFTYDE